MSAGKMNMAPSDTEPFDPDWCVHPGATLRDWMEENEVGLVEAARRCGLPILHFRRVLAGRAEITHAVALKLAAGAGGSAAFWVERERQFREALATGKTWMR